MRDGKSVFRSDSEKAEGFNQYFTSVYSTGPNPTVHNVSNRTIAFLHEINVSVSSVEKRLASCDDSVLMGYDHFPSFIARMCSSQLAPVVTEFFTFTDRLFYLQMT